MKTYVVEIQEVHTAKLRVTANSQAEAFLKVHEGEGEEVPSSLSYLRVLDDNPLENLEQECPGILKGLKALKADFSGDDETYVRAIEEVR